MQSNNPLVSIISPCYNQAAYMSEMLESVLNQTYPNWECIMINDGSTDNTEEIALDWCSKDSRFKYITKVNSGVSDTRNHGIANSQGDLILPLDADDKMSPEYLERAVQVFVDDDNTKIVYCNCTLFGVIEKNVTPIDYEFEKMLLTNLIHNTAMYKRSDFMRTKGYNPNMHEGLEDWDFLLGFLKPEDKVVRIEEYLFHYRIKNVSRSTLINEEKNKRLYLQIFKNHADLYLQYLNPIMDKIEGDHNGRLARFYKKSIEYRFGSFVLRPLQWYRKFRLKYWGK